MCHPEVPAGTTAPDVRTEEVAIDVGGGEAMPALLAFPERTPAGAVLVINDVNGRVAFYEHLARRLAQAGFVALDPEYFFRQGPPAEPTREAIQARRLKLDQRKTVDDLGAALDWLHARPETRGRRLATIGFCMGGTFVLDLAARRDDVAASVSYYGFPDSERAGLERPLDVVDRMRGFVLGHFGEDDAGVGMENVEALRSKLVAAKVPHEINAYPGLGHGFLPAFLDDERSPGYEPACRSWTRTIEAFRESLV